MKKLINWKEMIIILLSVIMITMLATKVFASSIFLDDAQTIAPGEYENAQLTPEDNNNIINNNNINNNNINNNNINNNNINNNNINNNNILGNNNIAKNNNTAKTYNANKNTKDLPQTGIEDYNVGILLIICIASAIFAYKKVQDYKNI